MKLLLDALNERNENIHHRFRRYTQIRIQEIVSGRFRLVLDSYLCGSAESVARIMSSGPLILPDIRGTIVLGLRVRMRLAI